MLRWHLVFTRGVHKTKQQVSHIADWSKIEQEKAKKYIIKTIVDRDTDQSLEVLTVLKQEKFEPLA